MLGTILVGAGCRCRITRFSSCVNVGRSDGTFV